MERKKYQTPVTIIIPISCGSIMQQIPVCSSPADEGSLMSKEYIFEDFEDNYDTNPWEDVPEK